MDHEVEIALDAILAPGSPIARLVEAAEAAAEDLDWNEAPNVLTEKLRAALAPFKESSTALSDAPPSPDPEALELAERLEQASDIRLLYYIAGGSILNKNERALIIRKLRREE